MSENDMEKLFRPSSVAVIGASQKKGKIGHDVLLNLIEYGYKGKIYPINPNDKEIMGLKAYPSVLEIKGDIDLASKYFAVDEQKNILERIQESIKLQRFDSAIEKFSRELIREKDYLQGDKAYYYIPIKNQSGELEAYSVVFYLNPHTRIWKIINL